MRYRWNMRIARTEIGLSINDVAKLCGVTPAAVSSWERKVCDPPLSALRKMAGAYGTTVDYLVDEPLPPSDRQKPIG